MQRYNIRPPCTQSNDERCREYFTDLQLQAEYRHKELQRQREAERKLELEHISKVTKMWDNGESNKTRSRQKSRQLQRGEKLEPEKAKVMEKKMEYCNDLRKMITNQNEQRRSNKANIIEKEREVCFELEGKI